MLRYLIKIEVIVLIYNNVKDFTMKPVITNKVSSVNIVRTHKFTIFRHIGSFTSTS